jgi:hypothetical protein
VLTVTAALVPATVSAGQTRPVRVVLENTGDVDFAVEGRDQRSGSARPFP